MSAPQTLREAALKVAAIGALRDRLDKAYRDARAEAEEVFAAARKEGATQQRVLLPDDTDLGLISIRGGSRRITYTEPDALFDWCAEHLPSAIEDYLAEGAAGMEDVIALVSEHFPNLARARVRRGTQEALERQIAETGGFLIDDAGEKTRVATVTQDDPTGAFAYRAGGGAQDKILAALWDQLRPITARALAIEGGDGK